MINRPPQPSAIQAEDLKKAVQRIETSQQQLIRRIESLEVIRQTESITYKPDKLLWHAFARWRPQPRTGTAAHDHGRNKVGVQAPRKNRLPALTTRTIPIDFRLELDSVAKLGCALLETRPLRCPPRSQVDH
jgi:hypothetical protein